MKSRAVIGRILLAVLALVVAPAASGCGDDISLDQPDLAVAAVADLAVTPLPTPLLRFAVIGDFGVDTVDEMAVARLVKEWRPDFIVTVGDNNYPSGETLTIDANIGQYFASYIGGYHGKYGTGSADNRFWPSLGNHDWYSQTGAQPYVDYFPTLPGNRRYYDVAVGPVHLFAVDSDAHEPDGIDAGSRQAAWLAGALAASTECFNLVYFHHPAYSSGDPLFTEPRMRWPFRAWGADLVLTGHQHQYERLVVDGLTYVVDGLGGALNRFGFLTTQPGSLVRYYAEFGALFVEVYGDHLQLAFRNVHGVTVDEFAIARDCTMPRPGPDGGP